MKNVNNHPVFELNLVWHLNTVYAIEVLNENMQASNIYHTTTTMIIHWKEATWNFKRAHTHKSLFHYFWKYRLFVNVTGNGFFLEIIGARWWI